MDKQDGHIETFSVVLDVSPEVNKEIPAMDIETPPKYKHSKNMVCCGNR